MTVVMTMMMAIIQTSTECWIVIKVFMIHDNAVDDDDDTMCLYDVFDDSNKDDSYDLD